MPLSDVKVRNTKPTGKPFKLHDENGLFLQVASSGSKLWRMKYRRQGKEKLLAFGKYPAISLKEARERRDAARLVLDRGDDPATVRQAEKARDAVEAEAAAVAALSFRDIADEWLGKHLEHWSQSHSKRLVRLFERDVYPRIGSLAVVEIRPADVLVMARPIQERGAIETAHRAVQNVGQVMRYAVGRGLIDIDPTQPLRGQLDRVPRPKHFAATVDPDKLGAILRAIEGYRGSAVVRAALRLTPLLAVRPGELRHARWADVDLDAARWSFTASKTMRPHIVPLAPRAVAILREIEPLTGHGIFVFPSERNRPRGDRPISENAVLVALRSLGIEKSEATPHGFRAVFRTLLDEKLRYRIDLIETQLAHTVRDPLGRSYNRTQFLEERIEMMTAWAEYLDELAGA